MVQAQSVNQQPDFIPAETPDFIPDSGQHLSSASRQLADQPFPQGPDNRPNAAFRFLGAAGKTALAGTLNAGPQQAALQPFTPDEQQQYSQGGMWAQLKKIFSDSSQGNVPGNAFRDLTSPISQSAQAIQEDPASGAGSALMQLLMLRQGFKQARGTNVAEFGSPNAYAEQVSPLSGYQPAKPTVQAFNPYSPRVSATVPSRPTPNMVIYQEPAPAQIPRDTNTLTQSRLIQQIRDAIDRQNIGGGEAGSQEVLQRMAQYAKTPVDKAGQVVAQAEGQASAVPAGGTPKFAYRVRDAGETGIMPLRGKPQASLDPTQVQQYSGFRAQAQNAPQEMVRVDLSKLDPSEYTVHPNGFVTFKSAIPEAFIEKMAPKTMVSGSDLIEALRQMANRGKPMAARAGGDD